MCGVVGPGRAAPEVWGRGGEPPAATPETGSEPTAPLPLRKAEWRSLDGDERKG